MNDERKRDPEAQMRRHYRLLVCLGCGVAELRTFDGVPMVAYVDNKDDLVRLCRQMDGKVSGIYIGVQPRPLYLFDKAPNRWRPAHGQPNSNCACDNDIEYIVACFFDIDVVSDQRQHGYPASEQELENSLRAAQLLSRENGLALSATIGESGNGHYVLAPIVPVEVDCDDIGAQFKTFCQQLVEKVTPRVSQVKLDPVFNLSRVMRVMGTVNNKGKETPERPHRRACFVTEPMLARSMALHHMILNTDVPNAPPEEKAFEGTIRGDLKKVEKCEFIQWCRDCPEKVSEPQWFGLISNLARLEGGAALVHEISRLDAGRYDHQHAQRLIERVLDNRYQPIHCEKLVHKGNKDNGYGHFTCSQIERCLARAPMYMAVLRTVYRRSGKLTERTD